MIPEPAPRLSVQSDLELTMGDVRATLVGDGHQFTLRTDDASALLRQISGVPTGVVETPPLRDLVGRLAGMLHDAGLTASIEDGRGSLLELGYGCRSQATRLLLGTEHARLGAVRALAPAAAGYLAAATSLRQRLVAATTGVALAAMIVVTAAQRRHVARERTLP